jgi:hypothetical protein
VAAAGGIISLVKSLPIILSGLRLGLADFKNAALGHAAMLRTERDLSMKVVSEVLRSSLRSWFHLRCT